MNWHRWQRPPQKTKQRGLLSSWPMHRWELTIEAYELAQRWIELFQLSQWAQHITPTESERKPRNKVHVNHAVSRDGVYVNLAVPSKTNPRAFSIPLHAASNLGMEKTEPRGWTMVPTMLRTAHPWHTLTEGLKDTAQRLEQTMKQLKECDVDSYQTLLEWNTWQMKWALWQSELNRRNAKN